MSIMENDWFMDLQAGKIAGHQFINAIGERENMGTTAQGEDIWRGNELSVVPATLTSHTLIPTPAAAGEQFTFISESNSDNGGTVTGILTLRFHYIKASDGLEYTEDIILNGTTGVDSVITDGRFINDMYALTVGSNGVAEGHIRVYKKGSPELVYNMIALGGNKSLVPHRMIPTGKKLILGGWHGAEVNSKNCALRIRSTDMYGVLLPGVFCFKGTSYVNKQATGQLNLHALVPALSIVKISGWPSQSTAIASVDWWGILRDDLIQ